MEVRKMAIVVKTNIETAVQYASGSVETDSFKKKQQVFFKVTVNDYDLKRAVDFAKTDDNIIMIKYEGDPVNISVENIDFTGVYVAREFEVTSNFELEDMEHIMEKVPNGMHAIIKLPADYNNMELLYQIQEQYKNVRFCGGYLFNTGEIKLGCIGKDIADAKGIRYKKGNYLCEGCACVCDTFEEYEVNLHLVEKKRVVVKKKSTKVAKKSSTGEASKPKKKSYADLISNTVSL